LSLALVVVMLIGVIMAEGNQIVKLDDQVGTVVDTILLIARTIMAILSSRVIHSLRNDAVDQYGYEKEEIDDSIAETIQVAMARIQQAIVSQLEGTLSQSLDECLSGLHAKQAEAFARLKAEQVTSISETNEMIMATLETALQKYVRKTRHRADTSTPSNVPSSTEATSRKPGNKGEHTIDTII
jgi:hypothetical protein